MIRGIWKNRRRRILAAATTLGLCGAIAFAGLLVDGTGPAQGKIGTPRPLEVQAGTLAGSECFLGQACDGYIVVTNPNPVEVTVQSVVDAVGVGAGFQLVSGSSACDESTLDLVLDVQNVSGLDIVLEPNTPTPIAVPGLFVVAQSSVPTTCFGNTFSKRVKVQTG